MDPVERDCRRKRNVFRTKVAAGRCNYAADKETDNDGTGLHDGRAEAFAKDDCYKDRETKTEELGRAPWRSHWRVDVGTESQWASFGTQLAAVAAAAPVVETRLNELCANKYDDGTSDETGEDLLENSGRDEGACDFEEGADGRGSQDGTVAIGTGQFGAVSGSRTLSVGVHLWDCTGNDCDGRKGGSDNRDHTCANVVLCKGKLDAGDLDSREQARADQGGRYKVLGDIGLKIGDATNDDWGSNYASQHGKRVLEPEDHTQKERHVTLEREKGLVVVSFEERQIWREE